MKKYIILIAGYLMLACVAEAQTSTKVGDAIKTIGGWIKGKNKKPADSAVAAGTVNATSSAVPQNNGQYSVKGIDNGIDFAVIGCTGNASAQTVTVNFTFANLKKVNQRIALLTSWCCMERHETRALDDDGNVLMPSSISLANNSIGNYQTLEMELINGGHIKGSITFINVLPTVGKLALVNICNTSENWDGRGDSKWGLIEIKNLAINWANTNPSKSNGSGLNATAPQNAGYLTYDDLLSKLNAGQDAKNNKVILDNIYFETNNDVITDKSKSALQNVLKLLIKYPKLKITILGHTDNAGREDDNLELSTSRAHAVVNYLVSKGVDRNRMFYKGFGSAAPIGDNNTADGRAKNRRTELEVMEQ